MNVFFRYYHEKGGSRCAVELPADRLAWTGVEWTGPKVNAAHRNPRDGQCVNRRAAGRQGQTEAVILPGSSLPPLAQALSRAKVVIVLLDDRQFKEFKPALGAPRRLVDAKGIWR
jgi:hypothetical protein